MTAIIALKHNNRVYMGGDRAATDMHGNIGILGIPKVFNLPVTDDLTEYVLGCSGMSNLPMLIRFKFNAPTPPDSSLRDDYLHAFVQLRFAPMLFELFADNGIPFNDDEAWWVILMGMAGQIYRIASDCSVLPTGREYESVGSGSDVADGVMHVTKNIKDPKRRLLLALQASAEHTAYVRPPFDIVSTKT